MEKVRIYTETQYKTLLDILEHNGFVKSECKKFLWKYPMEGEAFLSWDPQEWFSAAHERDFLIYPEEVIETDADRFLYHEGYSLANNFDYRKIMWYHEIVKKLPNSIITTADENIVGLLRDIPIDNPFLKVMESLYSPVLFLGDQAYSGDALKEMDVTSTLVFG